MTAVAVSEKIQTLAPDLTRTYPRSPRETLGGYIIAARALDKCRAYLNGTLGEYNFDCFLDNLFFGFAEIKADDFKNFVATGASDEEVGQWIQANAMPRERIEIVKWNNRLRYATINDLPDEVQLFMEDYIPRVIPPGKIVHHTFDVFDIEEKRI